MTPDRKMHYCFLTLGNWLGNAGYVRLRAFANELIARGHRVSVIIDDFEHNRGDLQFAPGIEKHFVMKYRSLGQLLERRKLIKSLNADIVHFLDPSPKSYLALVGMSSQPFICDWDEWFARHPDIPFFRGSMLKYADYWSRKNALIRPVASKYLQAEFAKLGYDSVYIPYAAYLDRKTDGESPFTQDTLVYMGNIYPAYDHDLILEGARILKQRGIDANIILLGKGPDVERWREFARKEQLTKVRLPGYTTGDALWRHLRHAHTLLFPIRDTLINCARCPSKTYAYAQAKRPVITCKVGEVYETLLDKASYVAETPEAWADAMEAALAKPFPADVDYAVEQHNWSDRTDRLLAAITQAQAGRAKR